MIKDIIQKWEKNKHLLEEYFKTTKQSEYSTYGDIVRSLFKICINTQESSYDNWAIENMTIIDNGDYQGTLLFIIPKNTYQPSADQYLVTNTYYGSCSGCDTLQAISCYDDDLPKEPQVKEYMTLALHLVQKLKYLYEEEN